VDVNRYPSSTLLTLADGKRFFVVAALYALREHPEAPLLQLSMSSVDDVVSEPPLISSGGITGL
jgi:hypothetical protein